MHVPAMCVYAQAMQQTCFRLLHGLLANPTAPTTWGRLESVFPRTKFLSDFLRLSSWVQRRLKGELYMMNGCEREISFTILAEQLEIDQQVMFSNPDVGPCCRDQHALLQPRTPPGPAASFHAQLMA
jgi:hypothetical protein